MIAKLLVCNIMFALAAFGADANVPVGFISFYDVGEGGGKTAMAKLVYSYSNNSDAEDVYVQLTQSEDVTSRLYGLWGLKLIKSPKYDLIKIELSKSKDIVKFCRGGCILEIEKVSDVVEYISKEDFSNYK